MLANLKKLITIMTTLCLTLVFTQCGGLIPGLGLVDLIAGESAYIAKNIMDTMPYYGTGSVYSVNAQSFEAMYSCSPLSISCEVGGSFSVNCATNGAALVFNGCNQGYGLFMDGSISYQTSTNGSIETTTVTYDDYSVTYDDGTYSMDGSMTLEDDTLAQEYTIYFDDYESTSSTGDSFFIESDGLTMDYIENILDGVITFSSQGEIVTCTFSNFDLDTATIDDYEAVCTL